MVCLWAPPTSHQCQSLHHTVEWPPFPSPPPDMGTGPPPLLQWLSLATAGRSPAQERRKRREPLWSLIDSHLREGRVYYKQETYRLILYKHSPSLCNKLDTVKLTPSLLPVSVSSVESSSITPVLSTIPSEKRVNRSVTSPVAKLYGCGVLIREPLSSSLILTYSVVLSWME